MPLKTVNCSQLDRASRVREHHHSAEASKAKRESSRQYDWIVSVQAQGSLRDEEKGSWLGNKIWTSLCEYEMMAQLKMGGLWRPKGHTYLNPLCVDTQGQTAAGTFHSSKAILPGPDMHGSLMKVGPWTSTTIA